MAIKVKAYCFLAIDSVRGEAILLDQTGWKSSEDIEEYLNVCPMPNDPNYNKEDLINDLTEKSGELIFLDIKEETRIFLENLMNWLEEKTKRVDNNERI